MFRYRQTENPQYLPSLLLSSRFVSTKAAPVFRGRFSLLHRLYIQKRRLCYWLGSDQLLYFNMFRAGADDNLATVKENPAVVGHPTAPGATNPSVVEEPCATTGGNPPTACNNPVPVGQRCSTVAKRWSALARGLPTAVQNPVAIEKIAQ